MRLVVLVSGSGTNLQALLDASADPAYGATVVAVGADRDGIEGLARAERAGVPTFVRRVGDFATRAELIGSERTVEEIRASIGADSLGYVSLDGLTAATELGAENLCRACFDGVYPVALPEPELLGKYLLETVDEVEVGAR